MTKTTGMVLGKFLPPHLGHLHLINFARAYVDQLFVVVGTLTTEPIPGALRFSWIQQACPGTHVLHLAVDLPQEPAEHPQFWDLWRESLLQVLPQPPDFVFASEDYGHRLAQELGARFVMVDPQRESFPISGTAIRQDPLAHWDWLPEVVRSYYLRKVVIFGPESTGKSTLTRDLARHYGTLAVPEYARVHLEVQNGELQFEDIPLIAKGQKALEQAMFPRAKRLVFCDTDLLTTQIWSEWLFGKCPDWIRQEAAAARYDHYLLTDVDVPWVADQVRYLPQSRRDFFDRCHSALEDLGRPYTLISGDWAQRRQSALAAVDQLLQLPPGRLGGQDETH